MTKSLVRFLVAGQDGVHKGARAPFPLGAGHMDDVEPVQIAVRVSDTVEIDSHLLDGGRVGANSGLFPGLDDRERGLEGVEGVDCILDPMTSQ